MSIFQRWKRRPVIYNWDSNFVPTTDHYDLIQSERPLIWVCPEDRFIELESIHIQLNTPVGVGATALFFNLSSPANVWFRYLVDALLPNDAELHYYLNPVGKKMVERETNESLLRILPLGLRMIPSDRFFFEPTGTWGSTHFFVQLTIHYKRYDLT